MSPSLEILNGGVGPDSVHHQNDSLKADPAAAHNGGSTSPTDDLDETESSDSPVDLNETHMVNGEDWNHITKPGMHDVLLGRGGGTNNHSGNIKFRKLVNEHKMRYLACSKVDKPKVARQVVALWRKLDPPGRFLARQDESKRGPGSVKAQDNVWYEVGDKKAREKASQCLRERTPDVIPYIKHLREQQNAITEQGVSFVQMQMQQQEHQLPHPAHPQQAFRAPPQVMHPQAMPHHPSMQANSYFDPSQQQQQQQHSMQQFQQQQQQHVMSQHHPQGQQQQQQLMQQQQQIFPRRNSCPVPPQQFSATDRRSSLQPASAPSMAFSPQAAMSCGGGGLDHFAAMDGLPVDPSEMSEMEYQQHMMMMQQQMQMQQLQMQRLHQSRMQANMQRMNSLGEDSNNDPSNHHYQQQQQQQQPNPQSNSDNDDLPLQVESNPAASAVTAVDTSPITNKRSRRGAAAAAEDDEAKERAAPDRAISLMSLTPANPSDDNELSLEDYRQQLEEYIANTGHAAAAATADVSNKKRGDKAAENKEAAHHDDDGNDSDLEDDWEKEREKAIQQAQLHAGDKKERGVNRNISGMSFQSTGGMSLVSGFSGFTDMMNMSARDKKMDMARSACSNLSLMSELTDLSQNIDNLSLYDD